MRARLIVEASELAPGGGQVPLAEDQDGVAERWRARGVIVGGGMEGWSVRLLTRMATLSSSPRIRSAPQRGLLLAISRMSAACPVGGRPTGRARLRKSARNPARCHRKIVAGCTSKPAARHLDTTQVATPIARRCHGSPRP